MSSGSVEGGLPQRAITFTGVGDQVYPGKSKLSLKDQQKVQALAQKILQSAEIKDLNASVRFIKRKGLFEKWDIEVIVKGAKFAPITKLGIKHIKQKADQTTRKIIDQTIKTKPGIELLKTPGEGFKIGYPDPSNPHFASISYLKDGELHTSYASCINGKWGLTNAQERGQGYETLEGLINSYIPRINEPSKSSYYFEGRTQDQAHEQLKKHPELGFVVRPSGSTPGKFVVHYPTKSGKIDFQYITYSNGKWQIEGQEKTQSHTHFNQLLRDRFGMCRQHSPHYFPIFDTNQARRIIQQDPTLGYICFRGHENNLNVIYKTHDGKEGFAVIGRGQDGKWYVSKEIEWEPTPFESAQAILNKNFGQYHLYAKLKDANSLPVSPAQGTLIQRYCSEVGEREPAWQPEDVGQFSNVPSPKKGALTPGGKPYHANRVNLGDGGKYIAAQAPLGEGPTLKNRQNLFWTMALEQRETKINRGLIVDLSQPTDITSYYPKKENETLDFETVSVKLIKSNEHGENPRIILSEYQVTNKVTGQMAVIERLHHNSWKDLKTAGQQDLNQIIEFVNNATNNFPNLTPIIHCRAGVGRTGTLISCLAIDKKRRNSVATSDDDLDNMVLQGKLQRGPLFVQTEPQYQLVKEYAKTTREELKSDLTIKPSKPAITKSGALKKSIWHLNIKSTDDNFYNQLNSSLDYFSENYPDPRGEVAFCSQPGGPDKEGNVYFQAFIRTPDKKIQELEIKLKSDQIEIKSGGQTIGTAEYGDAYTESLVDQLLNIYPSKPPTSPDASQFYYLRTSFYLAIDLLSVVPLRGTLGWNPSHAIPTVPRYARLCGL